MATYEFYITDDSGRRITLLKNIAFVSISRTVRGYGTCHIGIPFQDFKIYPAFLPDRRLEVWRSPAHGATLREEGSFFLRKWNVYTREVDSVQIIEFYGRSPIDILRRQAVTSDVLADYQKTDFIDDMMKEIVDENFITPPQTVPTGELIVDGNESMGPSISHTFFAQNVLDILKELRDISFSLNESDSDNIRIYFDVVRGSPLASGGYGYTFRTYTNQRGTDRSGEVVFSLENGNIKAPSYYEDHLDSFTTAAILNLSTPAANGSATSPESTLSRWNTIVAAQQSSEATAALNTSKANAFLQDGKSDQSLNATILDSPGSSRQPRSLYGVDWDLGDLLPVQYAGKDFIAEVETVYVSVDEGGKENIVGMISPRVTRPETIEIVTVDIPMSADTRLVEPSPTTNYDTDTFIEIGEYNAGAQLSRSWIKPNFASIPAGATFTSAILKLTPITDFSDNARTMRAHRCLRDVVSNQATWNIWKTANNWGTAGCSNSTTDYDGAVELGNMAVSATQAVNVQMSMTLDHAELQKLYDGMYTNNGIILFVDTQNNDQFRYASIENATSAYRPIITIVYEV